VVLGVFGGVGRPAETAAGRSAGSALHPVEQVLLEIEQKPYCPDSLAALKRYLAQRRVDWRNWLLAARFLQWCGLNDPRLPCFLIPIYRCTAPFARQ
jgi:hypothetical protein